MENLSFGFSVASYLNEEPNRINKLYCLVYSFMAQSYENWKINIIHDGPILNQTIKDKYYELQNISTKIKCFESEKRLNHWGHEYRREYALKTECDILGFTNDDNYYTPNCLLVLKENIENNDVVICQCLHRIAQNRKIYRILQPSKPKPVFATIDLCCYFIRNNIVQKEIWNFTNRAADFNYIQKVVSNTDKIKFIDYPIIVHN